MKPSFFTTPVFALITLISLLLVYLTTLQTIPNGAEHYYMIDVGETQVVLNVWGTLHSTGYPLYVILSSALVAILRFFGVDAVTAPAVTSLIWGLISMALIFALLQRITRQAWVAACVTFLFGLTRTVWIHHAIAEIYTFGLIILLLLYFIALSEKSIKHRIYWLALLGGIGVAHHRAIAMAIPALLYAVYPEMREMWRTRRLPRVVGISLLLGLLGFTQYAYLYIRAQTDERWVYGEPNTLAGLWDQFIGKEAERFIGAPATFDGILANFGMITEVLITDMTALGVLVGVLGLVSALWVKSFRRYALFFLLSGGVAYLFHGIFYTDILSALILAVQVSVLFGWGLAIAVLLHVTRQATAIKIAGVVATVALTFTLINAHQGFILNLTTDPTGIQTIEMAHRVPPDSTLLIAWGSRHFAVGFEQDVRGELQAITLVDHKANFAEIIQNQRLITPEYTFYTMPQPFFEAEAGAPLYLRAVAPQLVELSLDPLLGEPQPDIAATNPRLRCENDQLFLAVDWQNGDTPTQDQSVFVHLLNENGNLLAQGDQASPVYGWRPISTWLANEIVSDVYTLDHIEGGVRVRYGLYHALPDGSFENTLIYEAVVECQ